MEKYYNECVQNLDYQINELSVEIEDRMRLAQEVIKLLIKCLADLKQEVMKSGFKDEEEEIYFFKKLKPIILSKLICYNAVFKIEAKKPYGGKKVLDEYFNTELTKLKRFYDNNKEFYSYYRTNSSYLDHKYFVRGNYDIVLSLDTFYFETDHSFSTSHDYKVAKILANDRIQVFLEEQLNNNNITNRTNDVSLNWTGSKVALIELIYGLNAQGVLNNGNADIVAIVRFFERSFNVDLGDFYHTYMELKSRKITQTKFLDSMREALIKKMEEQDER